MPETTQREKLLDQLKKIISGEIPPRVPPNMRVLSKRNFFQLFDEWKIEYDVEGPDTMPEEAGRVISAYLLIPGGKQCPPEFKPPFPAMIAYHQCNCDCTIGKEAVVGKTVERGDQAYGLELVRQGFVVLAPDAISCGERELPWRQERKPVVYHPGVQRECWLKSYNYGEPGSPMCDYFGGRDLGNKAATDGLQAVDLLSSLDFVDSERIGAIGHSLGQEFVRVHMACDPRIKIGITSPGFTAKEAQLACTAPRPLIGLQGTHDGDLPEIENHMEGFALGQRIYQEAGAPDNLILRTHPCTHFFCDKFKWEAYLKLKEFFGMARGNKQMLILEEILRESSVAFWGTVAEIQADGAHQICADRESLKRAFDLVFSTFGAKTNPEKPKARTEISSNGMRVVVSLPEEAWRVEHWPRDLRSAEQLFFENSAETFWKHLPNQVEYHITFPIVS